MSRNDSRHRPLLEGVGVVAALLAGVALLVAAPFVTLRNPAFGIDPARACRPGKDSRCSVVSRATVIAADSERMTLAFDRAPFRATVAAADEWEEQPSPGARVLVHRWEGGDIAYVTDVEQSRRHETDRAPHIAGAVLASLFLVVFAGGLLASGLGMLRDAGQLPPRIVRRTRRST